MAKLPLDPLAEHSHIRAYNRLRVEGRMYFSSDESEDIGNVQDVSVCRWRVQTVHSHVKPGYAVTFATLHDRQQDI